MRTVCMIAVFLGFCAGVVTAGGNSHAAGNLAGNTVTVHHLLAFVTTLPEPSKMMIVGLGLIGLGTFRKGKPGTATPVAR